jgi:hypothetical protein
MRSALTLLTVDQQVELTNLADHLLGELAGEPSAEARLCRLCDLESCGRSSGRCPVARPRTRRAAV